ncbi:MULTISPECIES: hypothetical protein [unclassified Streptomyces]|uniref:hypothetical protein n=1 Tax=unclassified Streptomyces TaxID=2593676 RepID=UPI00382CA36D
MTWSRKEDQVRRLLDGPHPVVPAGLALSAAERGRRLIARRRVLRLVLWVLLLAALTAALVAAALWWPEPQPLRTTPLVYW